MTRSAWAVFGIVLSSRRLGTARLALTVMTQSPGSLGCSTEMPWRALDDPPQTTMGLGRNRIESVTSRKSRL
jgi:hypothetical protein